MDSSLLAVEVVHDQPATLLCPASEALGRGQELVGGDEAHTQTLHMPSRRDAVGLGANDLALVAQTLGEARHIASVHDLHVAPLLELADKVADRAQHQVRAATMHRPAPKR